MSATTGIEWTDATWSPIRVRVRMDAAAIALAKGYGSLVQIAERMAGHVGPHCEHVSPGCANCYAETNNHRCLPANGTGLPYDRRSRDLVEAFVDEKILLQPLSWKRGRMIFFENQSDLFGEWVTDAMLDQAFAVMALCPQHTFQVLTKRPERMLAYLSQGEVAHRWIENMSAGMMKLTICEDGDTFNAPLKNVWLGCSVEDQKAADARIPLLLQTPAAVRFLSAEPLLGPIDLEHVPLPDAYLRMNGIGGVAQPLSSKSSEADDYRYFSRLGYKLDWVICGGESGSAADIRPMHPDWARGLRDQCVAAGVPFFFKQWGEWGDVSAAPHEGARNQQEHIFKANGEVLGVGACGNGMVDPGWRPAGGAWMRRVGKKAAGHLLDGVEWHQMPKCSGEQRRAPSDSITTVRGCARESMSSLR